MPNQWTGISESERFWGRVQKTESCWLWTGRTSEAGFGEFRRASGKEMFAHRLSYEFAHGAISRGTVVAQTCGERTCVNPSHLEIISKAEAALRTHKPGCNCRPCGGGSFEYRFFSKVKKTPGCWIWTGALQVRPEGQERYGLFSYDHRQDLAHRASYRHFVGPIPRGLYVLHKCDNPRCVRPDHLRVGTQADNIADMIAKGRGRHQRVEVAA